MKEIKPIFEGSLFEVISEPGDATRYSYFVYRDGPDNFCFMPKENSFRYPQRLNYYDIKDLSDVEDILKLSAEEKCNPYTLRECIRTIEEIIKID